MLNRIIIYITVVFLLFFGGCGKTEQNGPARVRIGSTEWYVDIADDEISRYRGLSGKNDLREDVGMLFVYDSPKVLDFCMRGCNIPLDIAFIDSQMQIVRIYTMQVETDRRGTKIYSSEVPAQWVLEVRGGLFARRGVRVGDKVKFIGNFCTAN